MDSNNSQRGRALADRISSLYEEQRAQPTAEQCAKLSAQAHLRLAEWRALTGVDGSVFGMYEISEAEVRLRPGVLAEGEAASLRFPCTPLELVNFVDIADVGGRHFEVPSAFRDGAHLIEHQRSWYEVTLDACYWLKLPSVSPGDAAALLCRQNPLEPGCEPSITTTDETSPRDYRRLEVAFVALQQANPCVRSLADWVKVALEQGLKFHSWITLFCGGAHEVCDGDTSATGRSGIGKGVDLDDHQRPLQRHRHQEEEILRTIRDEGFDPARLPKRKAGRSGVKASVRSKLNYTESVFDKAWERLRAAKEIAEED